MENKKIVDIEQENGLERGALPDRRNGITKIPVNSLRKFKDYPFKVHDDESMVKLVESIRAHGVLNPIIVRECGNGAYEIISGHRRWYASRLAGLTTVPAYIRNLTDDDAIIAMVDANIHCW